MPSFEDSQRAEEAAARAANVGLNVRNAGLHDGSASRARGACRRANAVPGMARLRSEAADAFRQSMSELEFTSLPPNRENSAAA